MAEQTITTPGVFSRRSLFSAAAAIPIAAAAGTPFPSAASPGGERVSTEMPAQVPPEVLSLQARCREVGARLRQAEADLKAAVARMPEWARPQAAVNGQPASHVPAWTRTELAAFGLPDTMPERPSLA